MIQQTSGRKNTHLGVQQKWGPYRDPRDEVGWGLGFRVQGSGFRVSGSGVGLQRYPTSSLRTISGLSGLGFRGEIQGSHPLIYQQGLSCNHRKGFRV